MPAPHSFSYTHAATAVLRVPRSYVIRPKSDSHHLKGGRMCARTHHSAAQSPFLLHCAVHHDQFLEGEPDGRIQGDKEENTHSENARLGRRAGKCR